MEVPQPTNMGDLPVEMVELILSNLSWPDLAPISMTCCAFKSAFHHALPSEQERRCDLGVVRFGRKRINQVADLISRSLLGESLSPENGGPEDGHCWLTRNGEFQAPIYSQSGGWLEPQMLLNATEVCVNPLEWGVHMEIIPQGGSRMFVRTCRKRRMAMISIYPCNNEDLAGVALLQALLSWGLAPLSGNVGAHLDIRVVGYSWNVGITQAGLRMQIAPLLPFASQHISASRETGITTAIGERMRVELGT
jgi:hypothetical protein